jgi:hypothetical protein
MDKWKSFTRHGDPWSLAEELTLRNNIINAFENLDWDQDDAIKFSLKFKRTPRALVCKLRASKEKLLRQIISYTSNSYATKVIIALSNAHDAISEGNVNMYDIESYNSFISDNDEITVDDGKIMNSSNTWSMVSLLQENLITIKVRYTPNGNWYTFKTRDTSIEVGDFVLTNPGCVKGKFTVGEVVSIDEKVDIDPNSGIRYNWIVGKVDTTDYDKLVETDEKAYGLLVEAEKHAMREKLVAAYSESLTLTQKDKNKLKKLLKGE